SLVSKHASPGLPRKRVDDLRSTSACQVLVQKPQTSKKLQIQGAVGYRVIEPSEGIVALSREASTPSAAGDGLVSDYSQRTAPHLAGKRRGKKPSVVESVPIY